MNIEILARSSLFRGFTGEEISSVLKCLEASEKTYDKDAYIFRQGEASDSMGVILRGAVQVLSEDYWGERQILGVFTETQLIGESYACMAKSVPMMVSAVASEKTELLLLNAHRVFRTCSSACEFHRRLVVNLASVLAGKNLALTRKINHIGRRTIRERVLAYLSYEAGKEGESAAGAKSNSEKDEQGSRSVIVPYNRQQLADYLTVDRSALSAELSKMQKEGIISYKKNHFILHKESEL